MRVVILHNLKTNLQQKTNIPSSRDYRAYVYSGKITLKIFYSVEKINLVLFIKNFKKKKSMECKAN